MKQNLKKIICILLVAVSLTTLFAGCGQTEQVIQATPIVPEEQLMKDVYERNEEINEIMTLTYDYAVSGNKTPTVVPMSNHLNIQVDGWECFVVGQSTLDEIVKIIDEANEKYVTEKTDSLIAERQAAIDKEYEAAKKEAESKGKTYDKEKKTVRTDDIHFDNPYTYKVQRGGYQAAYEDYQPTLLVDPANNGIIYLNVYKYGIPYVRLLFSSVNGLYNLKITQEADWIVTGVGASDVSSYKYASDGETLLENVPEFVDKDGRNKAAKKNIYMSGDISFGGGNFNWESLMTFCNALQLTENYNRHGFVQSSDNTFTYYTIYLIANPFEYNENAADANTVLFPYIKLVATFDPLSQVCINWTVDMALSPLSYQNMSHELTEGTPINVHDYQVDTNDYEGMRNTIKTWIMNNSLDYKIAYCAEEAGTNKMFGIVETGNQNTAHEIIIDGVTYVAVSGGIWNNGAYGQYIAEEKMKEADQVNTEEERQKIIKEHAKTLSIGCYVLDSQNNIVCSFNPDNVFSDAAGNAIYLAYYEETESGYKNAKFLNGDAAHQLLLLYVKTYKLNELTTNETYNQFDVGGLAAVQDYINDLFAEAEKKQQEQKEANNN